MGAARKNEVQAVERPPFLGVGASARGLAWRERLAPEAEPQAVAISQHHGLPELLGRVLAARGVAPQDVPIILNPTLKALMPDPSTLRDMDAAAGAPRRRHREARGSGAVRRLRCRRCGVLGAACALSEAPRASSAHLHSRPAVRGLRAQRRRHRGARQRGRPPHRHRRLRDHEHRALGARRPSSAATSSSSITTRPTRSSPPSRRWSIPTARTTCRGSVTCARRASSSWCWWLRRANCAGAASTQRARPSPTS